MGVVIVEDLSRVLKRATLHRNLSLITSNLLDTQIIYIDLINDFNHEKIRILLNGLAPFPEWKLILIIVFGIIGLALILGVAIVIIKKAKESQGVPVEERDTMITEDYNQN